MANQSRGKFVYFAGELVPMEIYLSCICARAYVRANDAGIVRSNDAQCNSVLSKHQNFRFILRGESLTDPD